MIQTVTLSKNIKVMTFYVRIPKQAKVMFSQVFVILSLTGGGGVDQGQCHNTPPPGTWSQHLPPPPGPGHNTSLLPLGPGHNTSLPQPWDLVTTPPFLPPWDLVTTPPSLPPWDLVTTPPSLPPPGTWSQHPPHPHRDYAQAAGTHPTGMYSCIKVYTYFDSYLITDHKCDIQI